MVRNTSTCVEKTLLREALPDFWWKHLHLRGENQTTPCGIGSESETPPPAWRKPLTRMSTSPFLRNTSTCVEKTLRGRLQQGPREKHLHLRGENACCRRLFCHRLETPPPAWRKPSFDSGQGVTDGNASTCVEKTAVDAPSSSELRKHLHLRGENSSPEARESSA